ncbi:MAG: response regulator [Anaerolineales bacterium]
MPEVIRILIVDDHPLVREGLQAVMALEPDMEVVGEAADGQIAVRKAARLRPDVILMDLLMPEMSGGEAIQAILSKREAGVPKILVLTSVDDIPTLCATIQAGAAGYVSKDASPDELVEAVRAVHRGSVVLPPPVATALLHQAHDVLAPAAFASNPVAALTEREVEVLTLVAQGLNNDDIAARLVISPRTVSVHVSHILGKLELDNRTQVALYALRTGLVTL